MAEGVVCHFFVQSVTISGSDAEKGGEYGAVKLGVVTRGELNKNWSHWTPSGEIEFGTVNPKAFAIFRDRIGQEFEVVLRPLGTKNGEPV